MLPSLLRRTLPLILAAGSLVLSAVPFVHAKSGDADAGSGTGAPVDVNFFYDTLKDDGTWYNTAEYGDVWQPHLAYKSDTWRPYTDGYWSYTDGGWMFVSNEDFGWAVYHYGRWTRLKDIGWAWVPGTDWAPAWVTWRASKTDNNGPPASPGGAGPDTATVAATSTTAADAAAPSATTPDDKNPVPPDQPAAPAPAPAAEGPPPSGDYVGWAPLPPERAAYTAIDYNYGPTVDVDFGIEPYDYCFTDVRYFGAPFVATVLFDPFQSYYCCERSVNITNIYYNHDGRYRGFYAGGPDYNRFHGVTQREIPRYTLRPTGGAAAREMIRDGRFNRVRGNTIGVAAPRFSPKGVGPDGRVKMTRAATLAKAEVSHGAPASAAANPAYKRASESFAKQNETYRAAHPNAPVSRAAMPRAVESGGAAVAEPAPKITTTNRAQEEERAARRAAGENVPEPAKTAVAGGSEARPEDTHAQPAAAESRHEAAGESTGKETRRSQREARRESARQSETRESAAVEARQTAREERSSAREERQERRRGTEAGGRAREALSPRVQQQRSAPQVMAAPRPQQAGGGGGGDKKQGDKKKN